MVFRSEKQVLGSFAGTACSVIYIYIYYFGDDAAGVCLVSHTGVYIFSVMSPQCAVQAVVLTKATQVRVRTLHQFYRYYRNDLYGRERGRKTHVAPPSNTCIICTYVMLVRAYLCMDVCKKKIMPTRVFENIK